MRAAIRDVISGDLRLRAASLVFTTLLAIVPLIAVSFSVLKGFGVQNQMKPALMSILEPLGEKGPEIADQIIAFVDNVQVVALGALGLALLFYTVVSLIRKIEESVNFCWQISEQRSFGEGFSRYLSIVLVGPVLVFSSLALTASLISAPLAELISNYPALQGLVDWGGRLLPYGLLVAAFTLLYLSLPNTHVRLSAAFAGGLIAGILWFGVGFGFTTLVAGSPNYVAIYAAFAALVVFMIWLFASWLIVLFGASVAFYTQYPAFRDIGRTDRDLSAASRERLSLLVMKTVTCRFIDGLTPPSVNDLASDLHLPSPAVDWVVHVLLDARLLRATVASPPSYVPARAPDTIRLPEILSAIRRAGDDIYPDINRSGDDPAIKEVLDKLDRSRKRSLNGVSIRDLAVPGAAKKDAPSAVTPGEQSTPPLD